MTAGLVTGLCFAGLDGHTPDVVEATPNGQVQLAVNLTAALPPNESAQQAGNCHTIAASEFLESSCFMQTRKRVQISRAYLFYRHLRASLLRDPPTLVDGKKPPKEEGITPMDGGDELNDLKRILKGDVCAANEVKSGDEFYQALSAAYSQALESATSQYHDGVSTRKLLGGLGGGAAGLGIAWFVRQLKDAFAPEAPLNARRGHRGRRRQQSSKCDRFFALLGPVITAVSTVGGADLGAAMGRALRGKDEAQQRLALLDKLDAIAAKTLGLTERDKNNGYVCHTKDPDLQSCIQNFSCSAGAVGEEQILSDLRQGQPVVCGGLYSFSDGVSGGHAALITGYGHDEAGHLLFLLHTFGTQDTLVRLTRGLCPSALF